MAIPLNYDQARIILDETFAQVEADLIQGRPAPNVSSRVAQAFDVIFGSGSQAYREVLLGCIIARMLDRRINIRQPYAGQGDTAFGGRTLDERAINPFLHDRQIPSTRGPYLSMFRRNVEFVPETRRGLRDPEAYDALLVVLDYLQSIADEGQLNTLLRHTLRRFADLREAAQIAIAKLERLSLPQYDTLIAGLLARPSGGRFPVLLVQAILLAMDETLGLQWQIISQGINVADRPAGAGGDITVAKDGARVLVIEVTEQPVGRARLVATFRTKIAPGRIREYLFVQTAVAIPPDVIQQIQQYFAQGQEVNFVEIRQWILGLLATIGADGRRAFLRRLQDLIDGAEIPRALKTAWNELVDQLVGGQS